MRPRRPDVTTLADVTINRSGESAVITYRDPAVHPVVFAIGPDIDRCSDAEIRARFNDSLHTARAQTEGRQHVVVEIPRGHAQLEYFAPAGQWVPRGAVLRCLIDESPDGEAVIYIDDHALSLEQFGGLLRTYTGWGMRIVFVEDDNTEPPLVEIRDPSEGRSGSRLAVTKAGSRSDSSGGPHAPAPGLVPLFPSLPRVTAPPPR
jgi:hypothetical protein